MISYLETQKHRMNQKQKELVERLEKIPEADWIKEEKERATKLYMWLHMESGTVAHRTFERRPTKPKQKGKNFLHSMQKPR